MGPRTQARLEFGSLREAWKGEATDFTPLLAEQLDAIGDEIGVNLLAVGQTEVATAGGRSIDIVAQASDGPEFVIENQYGRADHDHLTRGLAYAIARGARGLVVVAEEHRDEFRAVAQYLNELAEHDAEHGIAVWLVEAKAVRISGSPWAPLFSAVISPNSVTAQVEQAKQSEKPLSLDEFLALCETPEIREAMSVLVKRWQALGHLVWRYSGYISLAAKGPAKSGERGVLALFPNGQVAVPYGAFAGQNTGIPIPALTTEDFRRRAESLFGPAGTRWTGRTPPGWVSHERVDQIMQFSVEVAEAYAAALVEKNTSDVFRGQE